MSTSGALLGDVGDLEACDASQATIFLRVGSGLPPIPNVMKMLSIG
jgi:hypothetical protein